MKTHFYNELAGSIVLWLDNRILTQGEAFYNIDSNFYRVNNYKGLTAYAAPYKQFIYDSSISGARVITGVYVNGNFVTTGQSGFLGINYEEGLALFNSNQNISVSGRYSAKEINVKLTSEPEEFLIFDTKYYNKNQIFGTSGNNTNQQPYPIVYVRLDNGFNEEFAMGGEETSKNSAKLILICENQFQLDALKGILMDSARGYVPLYYKGEYPFNSYGSLINNFNYTGLKSYKIENNQANFIKNVELIQLNSNLLTEMRKLNPSIYVGLANLELETIRFPHYC